MYIVTISNNPMSDAQAAQWIFRSGQSEKKAYLYRIMIDSYAEKMALQSQVLKAGGWRQLKYSPLDACKMLDMPRSWRDDEPFDVDRDDQDDDDETLSDNAVSKEEE